MNNKSAVEFINSLVRNLQVLCHSNVDFSDNVEVIGHIYLSVDKSKKFNYIVNEKVCKSDDSSTVFVSNSFHADQKEKSESEPKIPVSSTTISHTKPKYLGADDRLKSSYIGIQKQSNTQPRKLPHIDRPYGKPDRVRHAPRENEPFKKFRKLEEPEVTFEVVKSEEELSFTAEPVFYQPSTSKESSGVDKIYTDRFGVHETGEYTDFSDTSPNQIDLTSIKEEPVDVYNENSRIGSLHNILNQVDVQQIEFEQSHSSGMENLQQLSNNIASYSEMSSLSPTAQQQQQILSLFTTKRKVLSLEQKVQLIYESESDLKPSQSKLAEKYGISKMTVCNILKSKNRYLSEWRNPPN